MSIVEDNRRASIKRQMIKDGRWGEIIMGYGKFEGCKLEDIPTYYLAWVYHNQPEFDDELLLALTLMYEQKMKKKYGEAAIL